MEGGLGFRSIREEPIRTRNFTFRARKVRKVKASRSSRKHRKKMKMSAALRKQRRLQGRYMGLVRGLSKAKQAQVKKVRQEKGYGAALAVMAPKR